MRHSQVHRFGFAGRLIRGVRWNIARPAALLGTFLAACAGSGDDAASRATFAAPLAAGLAPDAARDVEPAASACAPLPAIGSFVTRAGTTLMVDGAPFRVGGTNLYYLQQLYAHAEQGDTAAEALANDALDTMVCMSLRVARVWAFNDTAGLLSTIRSGPGAYHDAGLRGLDRAVFEARRRGIRLVMTLTNNWKEYGGLPALAEWASAEDRQSRDKDDFFSDRRLQGWWRDYAGFLARRINVFTGTRYADEPAILAWEIGNELRCTRCPDASAVLDTMNTLARHARAVFPRHLIGDGGEGFDDQPGLYAGLSNRYPVNGKTGASFHRLARSPHLDLLSYHFYPGTWGLDAAGDARVWIVRHEEIARAAGKVAYLGEYGFTNRGGRSADQLRAPVYDEWLDRLFATSGGLLGFFWQLVPPGRPNADQHAVRFAHDHDTVAVVNKWTRAAQ